MMMYAGSLSLVTFRALRRSATVNSDHLAGNFFLLLVALGASHANMETVQRIGRGIVVEGVGMVKRHTRPNPQKQIQGGIAESERSIHISNVMLTTSNGQVTRVGSKVEGNSRVRVARKTGEVIEKKVTK